MIPFEYTWPYEKIKTDIYVVECPFCHAANVTLPLKIDELQEIHDGKKKLVVFPCCYHKFTVVDTDEDYLLTNVLLRKY